MSPVADLKEDLIRAYMIALQKTIKKVNSFNYNLSNQQSHTEVCQLMAEETDLLVNDFCGKDDDLMWELIEELNFKHLGKST